ncbi:CDP-diacylglycerol--glycerol-3-phosphate 3-phosphatidyltransferase [Oleispira antarctica]|uniref:CDP-diacylglycerol--glycerol-3-phosphate 3-phosphatidyltransferase n=1 Tax=Oleispira antarctica TaxID=188908 RepID=A0A1Y5HT02_OLEAN|nr:CDP-diacylglycerol--glycerol-3-phosphate 3-phosphatidyltransferase [Oleispira antarctica]
MNLPNILTMSRILMIPFMVFCFYYWPAENAHYIAAWVFMIASFTDFADGYLARKLNQSTPLGAFLDPVADKLSVVVALALLVEHYSSILLTMPAIIIIGREVIISALREWMAEIGSRAEVAVSYIGKVKTFLQMSSITMVMGFAEDHWMGILGMICLYAAAVLTLWSMVQYLRAAWPQLRAT